MCPNTYLRKRKKKLRTLSSVYMCICYLTNKITDLTLSCRGPKRGMLVVLFLHSILSILVCCHSCALCVTLARPYAPYVQQYHCSTNFSFSDRNFEFWGRFLAIPLVPQVHVLQYPEFGRISMNSTIFQLFPYVEKQLNLQNFYCQFNVRIH